MDSNRNNSGRFVAGHKGAKPKGAINLNTREYLARLEKVNNLLESNLLNNINSLSKKEQVMLWLEIQKLMHIKLSKLTEPEPEKEQINKITFQIVGGDRSKSQIQPDPPKPSTEVSGSLLPGQVSPVPNQSIQYGAIDVGRVRSPNHFNRTRTI
jgi:hypothetical protein